ALGALSPPSHARLEEHAPPAGERRLERFAHGAHPASDLHHLALLGVCDGARLRLPERAPDLRGFGEEILVDADPRCEGDEDADEQRVHEPPTLSSTGTHFSMPN